MPNLCRANIPDENENRGGSNPPPHSKKDKKKKQDFKTLKNNTIKSLNEVEYFLNNFERFVKSVKLYKLLK